MDTINLEYNGHAFNVEVDPQLFREFINDISTGALVPGVDFPTDMPLSGRGLHKNPAVMRDYMQQLGNIKVLSVAPADRKTNYADILVEDERIGVPCQRKTVEQAERIQLDQERIGRYLDMLAVEATTATIQLDKSKIRGYLKELASTGRSEELIYRPRIKLMKEVPPSAFGKEFLRIPRKAEVDRVGNSTSEGILQQQEDGRGQAKISEKKQNRRERSIQKVHKPKQKNFRSSPPDGLEMLRNANLTLQVNLSVPLPESERINLEEGKKISETGIDQSASLISDQSFQGELGLTEVQEWTNNTNLSELRYRNQLNTQPHSLSGKQSEFSRETNMSPYEKLVRGSQNEAGGNNNTSLLEEAVQDVNSAVQQSSPNENIVINDNPPQKLDRYKNVETVEPKYESPVISDSKNYAIKMNSVHAENGKSSDNSSAFGRSLFLGSPQFDSTNKQNSTLNDEETKLLQESIPNFSLITSTSANNLDHLNADWQYTTNTDFNVNPNEPKVIDINLPINMKPDVPRSNPPQSFTWLMDSILDLLGMNFSKGLGVPHSGNMSSLSINIFGTLPDVSPHLANQQFDISLNPTTEKAVSAASKVYPSNVNRSTHLTRNSLFSRWMNRIASPIDMLDKVSYAGAPPSVVNASLSVIPFRLCDANSSAEETLPDLLDSNCLRPSKPPEMFDNFYDKVREEIIKHSRERETNHLGTDEHELYNVIEENLKSVYDNRDFVFKIIGRALERVDSESGGRQPQWLRERFSAPADRQEQGYRDEPDDGQRQLYPEALLKSYSKKRSASNESSYWWPGLHRKQAKQQCSHIQDTTVLFSY